MSLTKDNLDDLIDHFTATKNLQALYALANSGLCSNTWPMSQWKFARGHGPYVYVLIDPRDHQPFYVGKGRNKRYQDQKNKIVQNRIHEIEAVGLETLVRILSSIDDSDAYLTERSLIRQIGRGDNGPLLNKNDGGHGGCAGTSGPWKDKKRIGFVPWNKGLTKNTNGVLAEVGRRLSIKRKKHPQVNNNKGGYKTGPCSQERAEKIARKHRQAWIVTSPDGVEHQTGNLKQFSVDHNLCYENLVRSANKNIKCRGYIARKAT